MAANGTEVRADHAEFNEIAHGARSQGQTAKAGWFGTAPIAQRSAFTQTYATATKTHSNPTAAALTVTDGAGTNDGTIGAITDNASTITAVQELAAQINKLVTDLANTKGVLNSLIDDLQAYGLCS